MHFADLRTAQPRHMDTLMAMLQALAGLVDDICNELNPHLEAIKPGPKPNRARSAHHQAGIPYMLHDSRCARLPRSLPLGQI